MDDDQEPADEALLGLLDQTRADQAAAERSRERSLRQQAEESARFSGLSLGLAERGAPVTVRTTSGRVHRGELLAVGHDFAGLRALDGTETDLLIAALSAVRADAALRPVEAADARTPALDLRMAELLAQEAADRPRVAVMLAGDPEPVVGRLRGVGEDVVTVESDGRRGDFTYARLGSITEVSFLASG